MRPHPPARMLYEIRQFEDILRKRLLRFGKLGGPYDLLGIHVHKLQGEHHRCGRGSRVIEPFALAISLQHSVQNPIYRKIVADLQCVLVEIGWRGWRQIGHRAHHVVLRGHVPSAGQRGLGKEFGGNRVRPAVGNYIAIGAGTGDDRHHRDLIDLHLLDGIHCVGLKIARRNKSLYSRDCGVGGAIDRRDTSRDGDAHQRGGCGPDRDFDHACGHTVTLMNSSFNCRALTSEGAPLIGSTAFWVFGKAITSRIDSVPHSIIIRRSTPKAMPPWGGAPYVSASIRKPKRSSASSRVMPSNSSTLSCSSRLWIRIEPPPSSSPSSTMS